MPHPDFTIRPMSPEDLTRAIHWAADEGWNPGLDDAEAFYGVDPQGFLMGWLGETPVTAISVVRHNPAFGFLGFYLCDPAHRGRGWGFATWQAGIAHLGSRTIGLDGVPDQQDNYRSSGFAFAHTSHRYRGTIEGQVHPACRAPTAADMPAMLAIDQSVSGTDRGAYMTAWLRDCPTRKTLVLKQDAMITALGTIRACRSGHKIGPLFAPDPATAETLIRALAAQADARDIMIDVPEPNAPATSLVQSLGLEPIFACARMYRGTPSARRLPSIFGETTFELG
ncbi:MAG: GNAT family N-acetyltransferase [Pseudomonadota bacterium]